MAEPTNKQLFDLLQEVLRKTDQTKEELKTELKRELQSATATIKTELDKIKEENSELKKENQQLKDKVQNIERKLRKYNLVFYGIGEKENRVDEVTCILDVIAKLDLDCNYTDIRDTYRIGKFSADKTRPIVCEFVHQQLKTEILINAKKLKGTGVAVSRDLILEDLEINKTLRKYQRIARDNKLTAVIKKNSLIVNEEEFTYQAILDLEKNQKIIKSNNQPLRQPHTITKIQLANFQELVRNQGESTPNRKRKASIKSPSEITRSTKKSNQVPENCDN